MMDSPDSRSEERCRICGSVDPATRLPSKRNVPYLVRPGETCLGPFHRTEPATTKRCSRCKTIKPVEDYNSDRSASDGLHPCCRGCHNEKHRESLARHPEKALAREQLKMAVKAGRIVKPGVCEGCKEQFPTQLLEGHHADYEKPLEVEWLCATCHGKRHRAKEVINA